MNYRLKENSWIAKIAARKLRSDRAAIVFGEVIHLHNISKEEFLADKRLVKHELCHVKQYKENGFILFLIKYLIESIKKGYYNNKYEVEARGAEIAEEAEVAE
jgi:hypothetical protein